MIQKKIHFCWYGGRALPAVYERCVESWSRIMPDFEVVRWDESNTDFDNDFLVDHYSRKNWAFVSDFVRLRVVHRYGGIYLDADVEAVQSFSPLLDRAMFIGEEARGRITTGVFGAGPGHPFLRAMMEEMERIHAARSPYLIAPELACRVFEAGEWPDISIMPRESFYPYNPYDPERPSDILMFSDVKPSTYSIHHWGKAWKQSFLERALKKISRKLKGGK